MNRQQEFENSDFYRRFDELKEGLNALDMQNADKDDIAYYNRAQKIVHLIETYLSLVDFDLITQQQLDNLHNMTGHVNNIIRHIEAYSNEPNIDYWRNADNTIDAILPEILNIATKAVVPKKRNLSSIYSEYKSAIDRLVSEKDDEIDQKIKEVLSKINSIQQDFHNEIDQRNEEVSSKLEDLEAFHEKIKGREDKGTGELVGGLERQLDAYKSDLEGQKKEQMDSFAEIDKQARASMNHAVSIGLAEAFNREARRLWRGRLIWTGFFMIGIAGIIGTVYSTGWLNIDHSKGLMDILLNCIRTAPVILPLIWITIFCAKRRSETDRFYHEYLHKEVIANSYINYKDQIEKLGDEGHELQAKLMHSTVKSISQNPSSTLDKKHSSDTPAKEITDIFKRNSGKKEPKE